MTWEEIKVIMLKKFCPTNEIRKLEVEFWSLKMKGSDILGYSDKFHEIARLVLHLMNPEPKGSKDISGVWFPKFTVYLLQLDPEQWKRQLNYLEV
jgi:hypothetical protein